VHPFGRHALRGVPGGLRFLCCRVLVAFPGFVTVVSEGYARVVVGMHARLAQGDGVVLFLDRDSGFVWAAKGVELLGDRAADELRGAELLAAARATCTREAACPTPSS